MQFRYIPKRAGDRKFTPKKKCPQEEFWLDEMVEGDELEARDLSIKASLTGRVAEFLTNELTD